MLGGDFVTKPSGHSVLNPIFLVVLVSQLSLSLFLSFDLLCNIFYLLITKQHMFSLCDQIGRFFAICVIENLTPFLENYTECNK
jgi:hypothetical protein